MRVKADYFPVYKCRICGSLCVCEDTAFALYNTKAQAVIDVPGNKVTIGNYSIKYTTMHWTGSHMGVADFQGLVDKDGLACLREGKGCL